MKIYQTFGLGFLLSFTAWQSWAAEILPYPKALEKAKAEKKEIIVLSDGSDWLKNTKELNKAYKELVASLPTLDSKVIWAIHDELDTQTEEQKKAPKPTVKVWNYPAIQILDDQARPLYFIEGLKPVDVIGVKDMIPKALEKRIERDNLWKAGENAKGPEKVTALGKGLDVLPEKLAKEYKEVLNTMKAEDEADTTGYHTKYTFHHGPFYERDLFPLLGEKKFDEAYKFVEKSMKSPQLTVYQKQVMTAAKFKIAIEEHNALHADPKAQAAKKKEAMDYLRQVVSIAPNTDMGRGAKESIAYYTEPVRLKSPSWEQRDNRPVWAPMIVEIPEVIKAVGTYELEFAHKGGHTRFRNPRLKVGSKVISQINDDKDQRKFTMVITAPVTAKRVTLEVDSQGTGWFDGRGDIIVTKK